MSSASNFAEGERVYVPCLKRHGTIAQIFETSGNVPRWAAVRFAPSERKFFFLRELSAPVAETPPC